MEAIVSVAPSWFLTAFCASIAHNILSISGWFWTPSSDWHTYLNEYETCILILYDGQYLFCFQSFLAVIVHMGNQSRFRK